MILMQFSLCTVGYVTRVHFNSFMINKGKVDDLSVAIRLI